jgi:hypothetical protein
VAVAMVVSRGVVVVVGGRRKMAGRIFEESEFLGRVPSLSDNF